MTDIIIVGAGPAGLTAAIYALRAEKKVLIIEKATFGGQVTYSPKIENFPGQIQISGNEFADSLVEQVLNLGGEFAMAEVIGLEKKDGKFLVKTSEGEYASAAVIIAAGVKHRRLGVPRETELTGNGVSYCAVCDGAFFKHKDVCVIGGGNSAMQEAIMLSEICRKVTVVQNLPEFTGEERLLAQLREKENVELMPGYTVRELIGDGELTGIRIKAVEKADEQIINCEGMFIAVGLEPDNGAFAKLPELDAAGYIIADSEMKTSVPGIFAAGDCRKKTVRQITTACADGTVAALGACAYLQESGEQN